MVIDDFDAKIENFDSSMSWFGNPILAQFRPAWNFTT